MSSTLLPPPVNSPLFVLPGDSKQFLILSALPASILAVARRFRIRPSLLAFVALLALSGFALLHQHLNDAPPLKFPTVAQPQSVRRPIDRGWHHSSLSKPARPKITLAPAEELASVVAFIAALPSNALPDSVDSRQPIDPDLVLDFDTRAPKAVQEVRQLVEDTWVQHPVVLLSKHYSPIAREIKGFLGEYNLKPEPTVFDIDERVDTAVITPLLHRLTGTTDLPVLLLAGKPVGNIETIRALHESGQLRTMVAASGAIIDGAKKRRKGRRAAIP